MIPPALWRIAQGIRALMDPLRRAKYTAMQPEETESDAPRSIGRLSRCGPRDNSAVLRRQLRAFAVSACSHRYTGCAGCPTRGGACTVGALLRTQGACDCRDANGVWEVGRD